MIEEPNLLDTPDDPEVPDASGESNPLAAPPAMRLPAADGNLLIVSVGEALGRIVGTIRPTDSTRVLRIELTAAAGDTVFAMSSRDSEDLLALHPYMEELGLSAGTFSLDLRCCAKALYLIHRAALLDRIRRVSEAFPIGTIAIVAEAASGVGSTLLTELPIDLEALYARRHGQVPAILRLPIFPLTGGDDIEKTTLYALAHELDAHRLGSAEHPEPAPRCEDPHDILILSDFQIGTPGQRRDELVRFLGNLTGVFRAPGGLPARSNPIFEHPVGAPWRRGYRDLIALWKGGSWTSFRRRKLIKELDDEGQPPPLVDQEPFRAGRRLYLEMEPRHQKLLAAGQFDYPGRISPDDAGSLVELGERHLEDGRDQDAYDAFHAAVEARADVLEAHEGLGRASLLLGDSDQALTHFTHVIQLEPDRVTGHEGILVAYLARGESERARQHLGLVTAMGCRIDPAIAGKVASRSAQPANGAAPPRDDNGGDG